MKIYLASSWRNVAQPEILAALRTAGHEVYDFRNPKDGDAGFRWVDTGLVSHVGGPVLARHLRDALRHPRAQESFANDFGAMKWADVGVLLLPCGRSAHPEAGWMAGAGKPVLVLAPPNGAVIEPELMYGLLGELFATLDGLLAALVIVSRALAEGRQLRPVLEGGA